MPSRSDRARARDTLVDAPAPSPSSDVREIGPAGRVGRLFAERYRLRAMLGYGSSGAVYDAWDERKNEAVAIKVMHEHLRGEGGHVARFVREARTASAVAHSSIVRVLDAGMDKSGSLYTVFELLDGELLIDAFERGLSIRDVVEIGRQLLGALGAAQGVIHRDVKPENLLLASSSEGALRLKVLDFGIAKWAAPDASFQTADGLVLGTPEYMSPEVCRGMPVTAAADLWAAAAVLFEGLVGAPPFQSDHVGRLLLKIVRERALLVRVLRPDVPAALAHAIDRALEPDPSARWATARDFASALASGAPIADLDWEDL